ncbi:hypothetical protein ABKV19_013666, partial [Rosa sericea]
DSLIPLSLTTPLSLTHRARDAPPLLLLRSASQSDQSHVFSSVRRDLNFIDHISDLGWKE